MGRRLIRLVLMRLDAHAAHATHALACFLVLPRSHHLGSPPSCPTPMRGSPTRPHSSPPRSSPTLTAQEANSTSSLHKWLPLDCCRSAAAKIVDASTLTIPPSAPGAGTAEQPARRPQHRPHCQSAPPTQAPGLTKIVSWDVNGGNGDGGAVRASAKS
jgi:hypothetical protein